MCSNSSIARTSRTNSYRRWNPLRVILLVVVVICSGAAVQAQPTNRQGGQATSQALKNGQAPVAIRQILVVQPFSLREGFRFSWSLEQPVVNSGLIVVLKADPQILIPRNTAERVLYAGDRTVQRLNQGTGSGYLIGIIPGELDLSQAPIWFGRPELPERVSKEIIRTERSLAERAGIKPLNSEPLQSVTAQQLKAENLAELLRGPVTKLVLKYAPDERGLADNWR
jgi:hypothetical protein